MRLAVDIDDVLTDTMYSIVSFYNKHLGLNLDRGDINTYHLSELWGCSPEEAVQKVKEWGLSGELESIEPIQGSVECLKKLSKNHELFVITSRASYFEDVTRKWIERHFTGVFQDLHFAKNEFTTDSSVKPKGEVAKEIGAEFAIEDVLSHSRNYIKHNVTVLLYDRPWNQDTGNLGELVVKRVRGWSEVPEHLYLD